MCFRYEELKGESSKWHRELQIVISDRQRLQASNQSVIYCTVLYVCMYACMYVCMYECM
jgi:hypothetical protein